MKRNRQIHTSKKQLLIRIAPPALIGLFLLFSPLLLGHPRAQEAVSPHSPTGICVVDVGGGAGYTTIQSAIDDLTCTNIFVSAGTYVEGLQIQRDLSIHGTGSTGTNATIISRPPTWSQSVVKVLSGATVTLSDLSVRDGWTSVSGGGIRNFNSDLHLKNVTVLDSFSAKSGGGIFSIGGTLTMEDSIVARNSAGENAGGVWIGGGGSIDNTTVVSNTAGTSTAITQTMGGGIFIDDTGYVTLKDSLISGNTLDPSGGVNVYGGGIYVADTPASIYIGRLTMVHTTVSNNAPGGISAGLASVQNHPFAVAVVDIQDSTISDNLGDGVATVPGDLNITDTVITRNTGDGIFWMVAIDNDLNLRRVEVSENGNKGINATLIPQWGNTTWNDVLLYDSTIRDNGSFGIVSYHIWVYESTISGNQGSGIHGLEKVVVNNSTISGNSVIGDGGGLHIAENGEFYMTNSTVSGNSATNNAGGIFLESGVTGALLSSTVTLNTGDSEGNQLGDVGGIVSNGIWPDLLTVEWTIIAGNTTLNLSSQSSDCSGDFENDGYNIIGVVNGCGAFGVPNNKYGTYANPLDPRLDLPADNGGPTMTHTPLPGSPARFLIGSSSCPDLDQRGAPRPTGNPYPCYSGAHEVTTCPAAVTPTGFAIDPSGRDALLSWVGDPDNREYVLFRGTDPYDPGSGVEIASLPNGVSSDFDFGVLEDVQGNYFYGLQGENACGERSAPTQVLGEFTFGLSTGEIAGPHVELISLPLTGGGLPANADGLAAYVDPGGAVKRVARWNPATSSFIVRVVGCPVCGSNFAVSAGDSLAIVYGVNAPPSFAWVGTPPAPGSITNPLQPNAVNLIQVPLDQAGQFPPDAAGLLANIGGVSYVASWSRSTRSWQIYSAGGGGTNFPIVPGHSYAVLTGALPPPSWP